MVCSRLGSAAGSLMMGFLVSHMRPVSRRRGVLAVAKRMHLMMGDARALRENHEATCLASSETCP